MDFEDLFKRIGNYNVFNFLLPGTVFAAFGGKYTSLPLVYDNVWLAPFMYYFYGMVISRIGSLILEPIGRKTRFLQFVEYEFFVNADSIDPKVSILSETSNIYRTILAMLLCLSAIVGIDRILSADPGLKSEVQLLSIVVLSIVFAASWRKQAVYVGQRCRYVLEDKIEK